MSFENRPISGSDYFQLLLNYRMCNYGQTGNISRIEYQLNADTDLGLLRTQIIESPLFNKVLEVRFNNSPFQISKWNKGFGLPAKAVIIYISRISKKKRNALLNSPINHEYGLVRVDLFEDDLGAKFVLFSMHHVLFDHRGMMNFIRGINGDYQPNPFVAKVADLNISTMIKESLEATLFAFRSSGAKLISLLGNSQLKGVNSEYHVLRFSIEETQKLDVNSVKQGAVLSKSVYYMAAAMIAVFHIADNKKLKGDFVWLAAPHDLRKRGVPGHLIGNAISFLYFRLNRDKTENQKLAVMDLQTQLKRMIQLKIAKKQDSFLHLFRRVPLVAYQAMTNLASAGKVASLAFSDLGELQYPISHLCGNEILQTSYYPPVPVPPGMSVVFNKENGQLAVTVGLIEGLFTKEESASFLNELKNNLLGIT